MHWRVVLGFCNIFFWMILPGASAQQGFFNFNYPGPYTIPVDPASCNNALAGHIGTPTVASTAGGMITYSAFDPDSSHFQLNDTWTFPEVAHVYWKVQDDLGHTAYFEFFITFTDTTKPVINPAGLPPSVTYASISLVPAAPTLTASDSCSSSLTVTLTQSTPPALCQGGVFTRTWLATDQSGNTGVFKQTITILQDTAPPTVVSAPQNGSAACTQVATAYPLWLAAQMSNFAATDPSGIASYINNGPGAITGNCPLPVTVTFTATDSCGFSVTRTATFTTIDTHGPDVLTPPKDSIAACSPPAANHLAALSDWIHRRARLVVKDSCTADAQLAYSMQIGGLPVDSAQVMTAFAASFANGCSTQPVGSQIYAKVHGIVRVDFYATDACGNSTYVGRGEFGAIDTVAPVITGTEIVEECGGGNDSTALVNWINSHGNTTVSDDCSAYTWSNFSWITSTGQTGNGLFNSGPYPAIQAHNCGWYVDVTFRATDDCGNTGSGTVRFRIKDTTQPVFNGLPPLDTLYCPNTTPPLPTAYVSDNCDSALAITSNFQILNPICTGAYTLLVTWIATDDCGNTRTATQSFMVRDTTKPVFTLVPPALTFRCDTFVPPAGPVLGQGIAATDNCGTIANLTFADISAQDPNLAVCAHYTYAITRTFTVSDDCGNTATAQQVINVVDNIPPQITGFLDTTIICVAQPVTPPPTATDVCTGHTSPPLLVNDIFTSGNCDDSYTRTLSWTSTDICGNTGYFDQNIHVIDTIKPTLSGVPADVTAECNAVPLPPAPGVITGSDNCDESVDITFLETEIRDPNPANCAHWTNYVVRREWTATDNCGNSRTYTQMITVQDGTGPVLVAQDTVKIPTAPGLCGGNVVVPSLLSVYDDCTAQQSAITLRDTVILTATGVPPNQIPNVPVDTVVFSWSAPNLPPGVPVVGTATVAIALDNADSELPSETFQIYGEDGYLIGRTKQTNIACGFSGDTVFTLPASLLNAWLTDGQLDIILAPNGSGVNACNAYCPGGRARATVQYSVATQQIPVTVTCAVDTGGFVPYPPATSSFLDAGDHTIHYIATDCAGNSSTASTIVRIEDLEPPAVTAPAPITAYVSASNCNADILLPFPAIAENCGFPADISQSSPLTYLQFYENGNAGWVPLDLMLHIAGVQANAVSTGTLTIRHLGDNGNAGEFFRVYDEQNNFLTATNIGSVSGECSVANETSIQVSASQINSWAANGSAGFQLEANTDVLNSTDFISFCGPLTNGFDGISTVQVSLTYNFADVSYEINKGATTIKTGQLVGNQTTVTLKPGVYTVIYRVSDRSGNLGTASFTLTVRDTIPPQALCQPITIFTNPSGAVPYILQPQEINNGSMDNCSGANLTFQLSQSSFNCNMATPPNNIYPVTLTVTDTSGNSAPCTTTVRVETVSFQPTATPGVCEGGTVQLFANPPQPTTGQTYKWSGPKSFTSMSPNPFIPNATSMNEGTYTVTVTGPTGCTAVGSVILNLANLPTQPILNVPGLICQGTTLTLQTQTFGGTNVMYSWYSGTPANPTLLNTTTIPLFQIANPVPGTHQYYVKVAADGCTSLPSDVKEVFVQQRPVATVVTGAISVCPCEAVSLGTTVQGPGITYNWTGPANFSSSDQYPLVASCAQKINEGTYTLIIYENGCASAPVTVQVVVRNKPPKPVISGNTVFCQNDTIKLTCNNIPTAAEYQWVTPATMIKTTTINSLVIPNASSVDSGYWYLQVKMDNCISDLSDPKLVQVQAYPDVSATSNSPICQGSSLNLNANSTTPGVTYQWAGPGGFSAIGASASTNTPMSGTYTVTVTASGCTHTATVQVSVITPPVITSVTHTAPTCVDCATDNALLQATVFTQNAPLTYSWSGPNMFFSPQAEPVIPKVCTNHNGTYTLIVHDANGCTSNQGSTVINVQAEPQTPQLGLNQMLCLGSKLEIPVLNANAYGSNVTFEWHTPVGIISQPQSKLTIPITGLQHSGDYYLVVLAGDCPSAQSATVTITVNPIPPAPVATSNAPVCAGDTLRFYADSVPNAQQYAWTSTNFTAGVQNPFIPQATDVHEGCYTVKVTVAGCTSPASNPVCVEVKARPAAPSIKPISPICLDDPNAVLTLEVAPPGATGVQYVWYKCQSQTPLGPPAFPLTFELSDLSGLTAGSNSFCVRATINGCTSVSSNPALVTLDTIPDGISAYAGADIFACDLMPFELDATLPAPGLATGLWSQINITSGDSLKIVNPPIANTNVVGGKAGSTYTFVWSLSNGSCKNFSSDTIQVKVNKYEVAKAKELTITCFSDSVRLQATQGQSVPGVWTQELGQALLGVVIENPNDPNTLVRNLPLNEISYFYWTLNIAGCAPSTAEARVYTIGRLPDGGPDQFICSIDSCATLMAAPLDSFETGYWYNINNPGASLLDPSNPITKACNLLIGANQFKWVTNDSLCGDLSKDTMVVFFDLEPVANPDSFNVAFGEKISANVLLNDIVPNQYDVEILTGPFNGQLEEIDKGLYTYLPSLTFSGTDEITYRLCNVNPKCECKVASVKFNVSQASDCRIPTIITPNGDGYNDIFVIPPHCLNNSDGPPDNEVTIFNQWGDQVFHKKDYQNDWDGTYNGQPLPAGTYFFVVKLPGDSAPRTGFVLIQR